MLKTVLRWLPFVPAVRYRCGLCDLQFDGERRNCPACGGPVIEE